MMLKAFQRFYKTIIFLGSLLKSPVLLLCRLYWGWLFMQTGLGKLQDIEVFAEKLSNMNFPMPLFQAYLAAGTEFFGGICLILGFASRLASIPLAITMLTAYATAHREAVQALFSKPSLFVAESPFNFLLTSLIVLAFGPGRFSIDYLLEKYYFRPQRGLNQK